MPLIMLPLKRLVNNWKQSIVIDYSLPLVTCIMPTANRPEFMLRSIACFLEQDYFHKELVIIDDGASSAARLVPWLFNVRYFYSQPQKKIGTKCNIACEKAAGSIIVHWDDDDIYASNWVSHQVSTLLHTRADVCGLNRIRYYDERDQLYFTVDHETKEDSWLSGATLAYYRSFWKKHKFKDLQIAEHDVFIKNKEAKIFAHHYYDGFTATIHSKNVLIKEII